MESIRPDDACSTSAYKKIISKLYRTGIYSRRCWWCLQRALGTGRGRATGWWWLQLAKTSIPPCKSPKSSILLHPRPSQMNAGHDPLPSGSPQRIQPDALGRMLFGRSPSIPLPSLGCSCLGKGPAEFWAGSCCTRYAGLARNSRIRWWRNPDCVSSWMPASRRMSRAKGTGLVDGVSDGAD